MLEFINLLSVAGEFETTLAAWFGLALVPALIVAWGLALGNEKSILDDFIVQEATPRELPSPRIAFLEETIDRLLQENHRISEENRFLRYSVRALARDNDELLEEANLLQETLFQERFLKVVDLRVEEVRLLEAHLRDVGTCARA